MVNSMQLSQIAKSLEAQLIGSDASFDSVSIDTRTLKPNQLYVALSGDQFNGHDYLANALEAGAVAAIVSEAESKNIPDNFPRLLVTDTRVALGQIARLNREASDTRLVAVTGSSGKTTVKEMLYSILSEMGSSMATKGNFNNDIGVPLSLLRLGENHQYGVIELGASAGGEIDYLVSLVEPDVAIITNVARAHLSGFGRLSDVANAKGEILGGIRPGGTAVLNADDEFYIKWRLSALSQGSSVSAFSVDPSKIDTHVDFYCSEVDSTDPGQSSFVLVAPNNEISITLRLPGAHNLANALAAAAAATAMGATIDQIKIGLESVQPVPGRMIPYKGINNSIVIDDSYNANPGSVQAAIEALARYPGRRIFVLGDMGELGEQSQSLHREVGQLAAQNRIDAVFTLGEKSAAAYAEYIGVHLGAGGAFLEREKLLSCLVPKLNSKTVVLVKGSRSAHMEQVVEVLKSTDGAKSNGSVESTEVGIGVS